MYDRFFGLNDPPPTLEPADALIHPKSTPSVPSSPLKETESPSPVATPFAAFPWMTSDPQLGENHDPKDKQAPVSSFGQADESSPSGPFHSSQAIEFS